MALRDCALAPVVTFERAVHGEAHLLHAGQRAEAVFDLAVERGHAIDGVARTIGIEVEHVTIVRGDAEILVLKVGQRARHQHRAAQQHKGERRLHHDQRLLRK